MFKDYIEVTLEEINDLRKNLGESAEKDRKVYSQIAIHYKRLSKIVYENERIRLLKEEYKARKKSGQKIRAFICVQKIKNELENLVVDLTLKNSYALKVA